MIKREEEKRSSCFLVSFASLLVELAFILRSELE